MISITFCISLFSVVLAFNVTMYRGSEYFNNGTVNHPVPIVKNKYKFVYHLADKLMMKIKLKNQAPDVTGAVYILLSSTPHTQLLPFSNNSSYQRKNMTKCREGDCSSIRDIKLNCTYTFIGLQFSKGTVCDDTGILMEGTAVTNRTVDDLCLNLNNCVFEIDLQNVCNESIAQQPSTPPSTDTPSSLTSSNNNVLTYVISSVIAIVCVLTLTIYISAKKCRHRDSNLVETMEMNTYNSPKEIIYADLGFAAEHRRPPDGHMPAHQEEESPYAQIIGVIRPKDQNE